MSINIVKANFLEAQKVLQDFISDETNLEAIASAGDIMIEAINGGNKIFSVGNGGSMCDAMHFAEEMTGRFRRDREPLPAISVADASHITCAANDYGFESIFSRYMGALGTRGDVLLAISTSGNSKNIYKTAELALQKGMKVIGLTGNGGGKLHEQCTLEIRVPHLGWSDRIQEIHIKIIHTLIHYVEVGLGVGQE